MFAWRAFPSPQTCELLVHPSLHCPFAADCVAWKSSDLFCSLLLLPIRHSHSDLFSIGILWTIYDGITAAQEKKGEEKSRYVLMYDIFPKFIYYRKWMFPTSLQKTVVDLRLDLQSASFPSGDWYPVCLQKTVVYILFICAATGI